MNHSFNLIDEPWIPCVPLTGGPAVEVGIRDALLKAREYREVFSESPLVTVSLHRLLLAILHAACNPERKQDWRRLWGEGLPVREIAAYLEKWGPRFDLFDQEHPFYQAAGFSTGKGTPEKWEDRCFAPIRLANEAPDQNQPLLFDHRSHINADPCQPAQAARWLVATQSYALCSSNSSNIRIDGQIASTPGCKDGVAVAGMLLWLGGDSLAETLLLNLVSRKAKDGDRPAWEEEGLVTHCRESWARPQRIAGVAQLYTWQGRLVRLPPTQRNGHLMVSALYFTQGRSAHDTEEQDVMDPMKAYRRDGDDKPWMAVRLDRRKAAWRDAHALLSRDRKRFKCSGIIEQVASLIEDGSLPADTMYTINAAGIAKGKEAAKVMLWRHDRFPAPGALLTDTDMVERLGYALRCAETIATQLDRANRRLCQLFLSPETSPPPDKKDVTKLSDSIHPRRAYWSRLEGKFHTLLHDLPADKERATDEWLHGVKTEADRAFHESAGQLGQSPRAIRARARVYANFDPEAEDKQKSKKARTIGEEVTI